MRKEFPIELNNQQCTVKLYIQTGMTKQPVRCIFKHQKQPDTVYYDHTQKVSGKGYFFIRLPQSPKVATVIIESPANVMFPTINAKSKVPYEILPLQQKLDAFPYKNPYVKEFVNFAQWFAEDYSLLSSRGSVFASRKSNFRIDIHEILIYRSGKLAGKQTTSPARIGVQTKIIEVANKYYRSYSIPEKFCILTHEFGHGYLNNKVENEFEADRNALNICLGLGYPRSAIKKVWIKIFLNAQTEENLKRWYMIRDYIDNFAKGDIYDDYYYSEEKR